MKVKIFIYFLILELQKILRKSIDKVFFVKLGFESDKTKLIDLHFNESNELDDWCETLKNLNISQRFANNHEFILGNLGRDIGRCVVCAAYFSGIFFQGYQCTYCECRVHKLCLKACSTIFSCEVNVFGFKKNKPSINCLIDSSTSSLGSTKSVPNILEVEIKVFKIVFLHRNSQITDVGLPWFK